MKEASSSSSAEYKIVPVGQETRRKADLFLLVSTALLSGFVLGLYCMEIASK